MPKIKAFSDLNKMNKLYIKDITAPSKELLVIFLLHKCLARKNEGFTFFLIE